MKQKISLLLLTLLLAGCTTVSPDAPTDTDSVAAQRETKTVATSFYPLWFLTSQIVSDTMNVINLAGAADVHEYEPSPQDIVQINNADLVIFQGSQLEPWIENIISELKEKNKATVEVSKNIDLAEMTKHESHDKHDDHDEHDDNHDENKDKSEDHSDHEADKHDEHNHGQFDPHTWLDPVLAQDMIDVITAALIEISPENNALFTERAAELKQRFASIDTQYTSSLSQCAQREVIISHDAFGYVARRYGFETHAITGLSTQDEPSAKILAELKDEAAEGFTHILAEENNIRRFAETLSNETGLEILAVNPLGRGTLDADKDFFDILTQNLASFSTALNCTS